MNDLFDNDEDFEESDQTEESENPQLDSDDFSSLIIAPSDWTVETLYQQIGKQVDLDPAFQRRNVWSTDAKSRFIESLFLGVPIPQILLSAKPAQKNSFVVLDGKQRLLTVKEFIDGKLPNGRRFKLRGLKVLSEIEGCTWDDLKDNEEWSYRLLNETLRTAVIRGWSDENVLYEIFYRLNSGSVKLSPMELRMSLHPGEFLKFIVNWTEKTGSIHKILNRKTPDPRMNDVELAVRFLAFHKTDIMYKGNLKEFLDSTCTLLNKKFSEDEKVEEETEFYLKEMELAIDTGISVFTQRKFCRKFSDGQYETRFNRALFDILVGSLTNADVRDFALNEPDKFKSAFEIISEENEFRRSVETTTKSVSATTMRFSKWYQTVENLTGIKLNTPAIYHEITN